VTFASLSFLLFLALVFPLHWLARSRLLRNLVLLAASVVFYSWWDWRFCALLVGTGILDWAVGRGLGRTSAPALRRALLLLSLAGNLGILAAFKYWDFFIESLTAAAGSLGLTLSLPPLRVLLPVGISFYTFQTLSYVVDVYRGRIVAAANPVDYLVYVMYFPQLVAGPIERAERLLPQILAPRRFDAGEASDGCRQALWGLAKKVLVADTLAGAVDPAYAAPGAHSGGALALATLFFSFQIYADFSGYSDIALGISRLFGITLGRNFATPYFSRDLLEFWRRWHISLSTWFRDYVYVPLGGSRTGRLRHVACLMAVFLLSGLWHGAAWTFVIWGAVHGIAVAALSLRTGRPRRSALEIPAARDGAAIAGTFVFVTLAWIFFRARSAPDAFLILGRILRGPFAEGAGLDPAVRPGWLLALIAALVAVEWRGRARPHPFELAAWTRPARWALYTCLLWGVLLLGPGESVPFLYFRF
jgi:D-alanyl-lipoteichoic acid acyltransferase DltB (MBOAT superfamily)